MDNWNHNYYIYLMTNEYNTVIYTGMTNDLKRRVEEHRLGLIPGFTSRYKVKKLIYFEYFDHVEDAIHREKQIKAGSRQKKIVLIESMNPEWVDLYERLV